MKIKQFTKKLLFCCIKPYLVLVTCSYVLIKRIRYLLIHQVCPYLMLEIYDIHH